MSLWQILASLDGHAEANSAKAGNRLTETEKDDLFDWIDEPQVQRPVELPRLRWDGTKLSAY